MTRIGLTPNIPTEEDDDEDRTQTWNHVRGGGGGWQGQASRQSTVELSPAPAKPDDLAKWKLLMVLSNFLFV